LIPIIEGSGAIISDWQGQPLQPQSTEVLATANANLHQAVLAVIKNAESHDHDSA
jgi:fructose-1,6-bisphosphatase/inositol monophosphatase family enzyme